MGDIPASVKEQLKLFHDSLDLVESSLEPHFDVSFEDHIQRNALDQARIDLMSLYAVNGLYWMDLCTKGERPGDNEAVMVELNRIKDYMNRLKIIQDRSLAPKINQRAAKSFVRNALWAPQDSTSSVNDVSSNGNNEVTSAEQVTETVSTKVSNNDGEQPLEDTVEPVETTNSAKRNAELSPNSTKRKRNRRQK